MVRRSWLGKRRPWLGQARDADGQWASGGGGGGSGPVDSLVARKGIVAAVSSLGIKENDVIAASTKRVDVRVSGKNQAKEVRGVLKAAGYKTSTTDPGVRVGITDKRGWAGLPRLESLLPLGGGPGEA